MSNIYFVKRLDHWDYDDYDSFVAVAPNVETVKAMHPSGGTVEENKEHYSGAGWVKSPDAVEVTLIGTTGECDSVSRVVCASYNAG